MKVIVVTGEYYEEENFGDMHLHDNVFVGVFKTLEEAVSYTKKPFVLKEYDDFEFTEVSI